MNVTESHLKYFNPSEFDRNGENWFDKCSPRLLILLDTFRHLTGRCIISPHKLAIGRRSYTKNPKSQHSYDEWGEVRAVDVFPNIHDGYVKMKTDAQFWIESAHDINFTGIGLYPTWTLNGEQRPGLHLDVRDSEETVTWGYVDGKQVTIEKALEEL